MDSYTKMAAYVMKLRSWERREDQDGNTMYYNTITKDVTDIPDPVFLLLEDKLELARKCKTKSEKSDELQELSNDQIKLLQLEKDFQIDQSKKFTEHIIEMEKVANKTDRELKDIITIVEKIFNENVLKTEQQDGKSTESVGVEESSSETFRKLQEIQKKFINVQTASFSFIQDKENLLQENEKLKIKLQNNLKLSKNMILMENKLARTAKEYEDLMFVFDSMLKEGVNRDVHHDKKKIQKIAFQNVTLVKRLAFVENEMAQFQQSLIAGKVVEQIGKLSSETCELLKKEIDMKSIEDQDMLELFKVTIQENLSLKNKLTEYSKLEEKVQALELASASKMISSKNVLKLKKEKITLNKDLTLDRSFIKKLKAENQYLAEKTVKLQKKLKLIDEEAKLANKSKDLQKLMKHIEVLEAEILRASQKDKHLVEAVKEITQKNWDLQREFEISSGTLAEKVESEKFNSTNMNNLQQNIEQLSQQICHITNERDYYFTEWQKFGQIPANYYYKFF